MISSARINEVESFDPKEWDIRREGRVWASEEFDQRIYQAPKKSSLSEVSSLPKENA